MLQSILHLGRVRLGPLGDAPLSLSAEDAVSYTEALQARRVLPVHFEGWAHFTEGRDAAREIFAKSGLNDRTVWLDRGETRCRDYAGANRHRRPLGTDLLASCLRLSELPACRGSARG